MAVVVRAMLFGSTVSPQHYGHVSQQISETFYVADFVGMSSVRFFFLVVFRWPMGFFPLY
jgi:hypothetical protein